MYDDVGAGEAVMVERSGLVWWGVELGRSFGFAQDDRFVDRRDSALSRGANLKDCRYEYSDCAESPFRSDQPH